MRGASEGLIFTGRMEVGQVRVPGIRRKEELIISLSAEIHTS